MNSIKALHHDAHIKHATGGRKPTAPPLRLASWGLGARRTRRLRAILIRLSHVSSTGHPASGGGHLMTSPHRRSKPMLIEHTQVQDVRGAREVSHITGRTYVETLPVAPPSTPTAPQWFDATDALALLNSMVRRIRTRPCAKPLVRW